MAQFRDLQTAIQLGDIDPEKGVPIVVRRDGKELPPITVKPDPSLGAFFIGVTSGRTTRLMENRKTWLVEGRRATIAGSTADKTNAFHNGDKIVKIDDVSIADYGQINAELAKKADKKITVVVERAIADAQGKPTGEVRLISIPVPPNPIRHLGLVMKMGPIEAVQANSPATAAGIKPGGRIVAPAGDPLSLPDRLRRLAGKTVDLAIQSKAAKSPTTFAVQLRTPIEISPVELEISPLAVSALGVAYRVLNEVQAVEAGSPAANAGLQAGDVILKARLIPPAKEVLRKLNIDQGEGAIDFDDFPDAWPALAAALQGTEVTAPGTTVELTYLRQGKKHTTKPLATIEAADWFNPDRGLIFEPMTFRCKAQSIGEALAQGGQETLDNLTIVFSMLKALSKSKVSMRGVAGPKTIVEIALARADQGTAQLLLFLTMLSANLAVINFLPIPVLDGGHMVFLLYEGIRGKPADERVQAVLSYIGLILILALMVWALGLDFGLFSRHVAPPR